MLLRDERFLRLFTEVLKNKSHFLVANYVSCLVLGFIPKKPSSFILFFYFILYQPHKRAHVLDSIPHYKFNDIGHNMVSCVFIRKKVFTLNFEIFCCNGFRLKPWEQKISTLKHPDLQDHRT